MSVFNIKFKHMALAYAAFILLALYGCGDTVSQSATGGGSNCNSHDGNCATTNVLPEAASPTLPEVSTFSSDSDHIPAHCAVPVEALPGCSEGSFEDCSCYDPHNPAQSG